MRGNKRWQKFFNECDPQLLEDFRQYHKDNRALWKKFEEYTEQAIVARSSVLIADALLLELSKGEDDESN